ncbi:methionine adenosyltransferase [Candidatus Methylacidiphilum fumarolicum]|uniref:S-adenosylmethionine synthase n=2 Tax=Candidatus Methylacidiphilum fumarolicum TaxID=591154 RepID=I0K0F5_METFB|nr:methionine adenosyltransferase [Candidatus Methylacidiphilum fumarolicum]MBW6414559.1 methionine adenosyltransferase [Candidatus Methylacidiphilum fumarolicum]TFE65572.1 methionine adenosyltransferase [Candidatus Methylacidiphilum fumarolicum]TFE73675.1 methionine adenosyltransferase [Candidatus Methylacidiphilum fumarolicum]TFE75395.1 methionine adenosyltransferase [Candidatus Methylacidiphilum fumarolicum]TFE77431.1 methionine adenosyltransferase [Candidatus Methylacidiphilum fumarolicum]
MSKSYVFASESVTEGHPDKVCDTISDTVLDHCLQQDKFSRVACETLVKENLVVLAGEITTKANLDYIKIVKDTVRQIGYNDPKSLFYPEKLHIVCAISKQSPDIALGVDGKKERHNMGRNLDQGAGDQGMMFGFACTETPELMPAPISFAHRLSRRLAELRKKEGCPWLRPDGKTQVSLYYEDNKPMRVEAIVVSTQHTEEVSNKEIEEIIKKEVIQKAIPEEFLHKKTVFYINPTGRFVAGGPDADSGVTGRKIIVDTYGGMGRHGGGAFSGKDPSKVDRSAAYMARYIAKNIVAAKIANKVEVQIAYAIGKADPVSVAVDTFETGLVEDQKIERAIREVFRLKPAEIIEELNLLRPIYSKITNYGHFGRNDEFDIFCWEKTDKVNDLLTAVGLE